MNLPKLTADQILSKIENMMSEYEFGHLNEWDWNNRDEYSDEDDDEYEKILIPDTPEFELLRKKITEQKEKGKQKYDEITDGKYYDNYRHNPEYEKAYADMNIDVEAALKLYVVGIGEVIEVEQYGGEGQGDTWFSVKYFPAHDVYIRIEGYYQSYNGVEFHNGYGKEVKPKQKTITVFE